MIINCYSTKNNTHFAAELEVINDEDFSLSFRSDQENFSVNGVDLIDALKRLREELLEPSGVRILLNGCRRNFVSSRMQRQSTGGQIGYLFQLGQSADPTATVRTLDPTSVELVATVSEQDAYHKEWLASLKNG